MAVLWPQGEHSFSPQGKMLLEKENHLPPKAELMAETLFLLYSPWDGLWVPFHTLHALELWVASLFNDTGMRLPGYWPKYIYGK